MSIVFRPKLVYSYYFMYCESISIFYVLKIVHFMMQSAIIEIFYSCTVTYILAPPRGYENDSN